MPENIEDIKPLWLIEQEARELQQSREMIAKEERKFIRSIKAQQKREEQDRKKQERDQKTAKYTVNIGKTGFIIAYTLHIQVLVKDFKQSFGNFRYLVSPVAGTGKIWTSIDKVHFNDSVDN